MYNFILCIDKFHNLVYIVCARKEYEIYKRKCTKNKRPKVC